MNTKFLTVFGFQAILACTQVLLLTATGARGDALPIEPGSWTLAILPDTQHYAQSYPQHYYAQTQWLSDHAVSHNIQMVLHEGDVVNNNSVAQWNVAVDAMNTLNGVVPYAIAPGNHDYGPNGNATTRDSLFNRNTYFGPASAYANQPTVGGFYQAGRTDNAYHTFSAGGEDWLVLALEFGPRDEVVTWANTIATTHPNHEAILLTHAYMYFEENRYDWSTYGSSQSWNPHSYGVAGLPGGVNDGEELWNNLVSQHENFGFTFNGHVLGDGTGYLGSQGSAGTVVHQMLANFQMDFQGGNGYMRLLEFLADGETVEVRTYSPVTDAYDTMFDQEFSLNRNEIHPPLQPPVIYHAVGGNVVATGPTDPASNTVGSVSVPQSALPGVSVLRANRGDFQIAVDGRGLSYQDGILLATVAENERDGYRATVEAARNSFNDGILTLSVMQAGSSGNEVNFNTSVAWFMFDAGWQGAQVDSDGTIRAANDIDQSMLTKNGVGLYNLDLGPGANPDDGMLFAIANNNGNTVVQTNPQSDDTWDLIVRDSVSIAGGEDANFSFLYLPYDTSGLIGGQYDGSTDVHVASAGDFSMQKLETGRYELTVPVETPETGLLILTVAGDDLGAIDDNYLTYQNDGLGNFIIETHDLPLSALEDTEFVWAFIDFSDPIAMPALGDFNGDSIWDCADIDALVGAIASGSTDLSFDMNGDGMITSADITDAGTGWLAVGGANNPADTGGNPFLVGDTNLDGVVDGVDFIEWNDNKFTTLAEWCGGDFNADGVVDGHDFILWNDNKFMSSDSVSAVPEPGMGVFLIAALISLAVVRRR